MQIQLSRIECESESLSVTVEGASAAVTVKSVQVTLGTRSMRSPSSTAEKIEKVTYVPTSVNTIGKRQHWTLKKSHAFTKSE